MPAAPPQGGGGGGQDDQSTAMLWGVACIFVIFAMIWYLFKAQVITAFLDLKLWEVDIINIFYPPIAGIKNLIQSSRTDPTSLSFQDVAGIGQMVGAVLRIPFTGFLLLLAVFVYFGNSTRVFKNLYSMKKLVLAEKINWPQISPVANLDLVQTDIDTGPWAMAMTPVQFAKRNKLLEEFRRPREEGMSRKESERVEVALKRGEANKVFALQLGPVWEGIYKLPPYAKALFAVFGARINADTKVAANLVAQLNRSSVGGKFDYRGVDELCKKYESHKIVQEIMKSHAYVLTVMASMLLASRADGVQATADFLWLKTVDRRLWYMLNTIGRQTPFVESAGAFSHWVAEREADRKLIIPMVEGATNALELALKELVYNPEA